MFARPGCNDQLRYEASQPANATTECEAFLKMFTSGTVSGMYDPLDIGEYSFDGIKAAADEAALADILLINGKPLEDLTLLHAPGH